MRNPKLLWLELTVSGTPIPVFCTRLTGAHGIFNPTTWEILVDVRESPTSAVITLGHEYRHARAYLDNHLDWEGDEHELECDTFSKNVLEFIGGPPLQWTTKWTLVVDEWKRARANSRKTAKAQSPEAPEPSSDIRLVGDTQTT